MGYETLRYEQAGHVVTLAYDGPEQTNAINRVMNRGNHDEISDQPPATSGS